MNCQAARTARYAHTPGRSDTQLSPGTIVWKLAAACGMPRLSCLDTKERGDHLGGGLEHRGPVLLRLLDHADMRVPQFLVELTRVDRRTDLHIAVEVDHGQCTQR